MCTALTLSTKDGYNLFGRNMDLAYSFNQAVTLVPRNYEYRDRVTGEIRKNKYAILGMASVIDDYPAFADAFNEKGLGCAGLNFPGYFHAEENEVHGKKNIAPYDLILWILSNFQTVDEVLNEIKNIELFKDNKIFANKWGDKWGFVDKNGNKIVDYNYDKVTEVNKYGFAGIEKDGLWGVVDSNGKIIVEPQYKLNDIEPTFIGEYYQVTYGNGEIYYTK